MAEQASEANVTSFGIVMAVSVVAVLVIFCRLYRLDVTFSVILYAVTALFIPLLLFYHYYQKRENIRFNQVDIYIHQMSYSFKRNPKIITALKDTYQIAEGRLKEVLLNAIAVMESETEDRVYEEALKIIEQQYPCDRVYTLHRFLVSIEERGGEYEQPLSILLADFDRWVRRIYRYQDDMKHIKINSAIGIILSGIIASMSIFISDMLELTPGQGFDITGERIYQMETFAYLLINVVYFVYISVHYSRDWITPARDDAAVMRDYNMVFGRENRLLGIARWTFLITGMAAAVAAVVFNAAGFVPCIVIIALVAFFMPKINRSMAMSRIKDDVYMAFSEWLREVSVHLSHAPLQAAIQESYNTCPVVLKPSLARFIYELDENPSDVTPYYSFLKEFRILDISSTVKTLYSITENGKQDTTEVINNLISRKYELVDRHEAHKNSNDISVLRFAEYIPLLVVSVKLGIDMLLVIGNCL